MTDLQAVLPDFPTDQYVRLLQSIERNRITTADLLTLDCVEIAKRASLPLLDVKRLSTAILNALRVDLRVQEPENAARGAISTLRRSGKELLQSWSTISTLDDRIDQALGGGIPIGQVTEITGESGAGKTQFLLTLLLSAQLCPPHGLSSPTLYISTESALPTNRLSQLLALHTSLTSARPRPSLDRVISIITPDLESQDHILRYQVPVAIRKYGIRLLILDSVAANYRAEFERSKTGAADGSVKVKPGANMAERSTELVKLGQLLRDLTREENIAVVVANQVADRFSTYSDAGYASPRASRATRNSSPLAQRSRGLPPSNLVPSPISSPPPEVPPPSLSGKLDPMSLDHQQRWFTGWGDDPHPSYATLKNMKTPSLGLIWTTQVACRIALIKSPVYGAEMVEDNDGERGEPILQSWRRWMKVVFATHVAGSGMGLNGAVEFEISKEGIKSVASLRGEDAEG